MARSHRFLRSLFALIGAIVLVSGLEVLSGGAVEHSSQNDPNNVGWGMHLLGWAMVAGGLAIVVLNVTSRAVETRVRDRPLAGESRERQDASD